MNRNENNSGTSVSILRLVVRSARELKAWRNSAMFAGTFDAPGCPTVAINAELFSMGLDSVGREVIWDMIQKRAE